MQAVRNPGNEVCRMPWFLIKVKPTEGYQNTINSEYFIVHSVDINEVHSSNMYINGFVKFEHNQHTIQGNILLASEDRAYVEYEMKQLTSRMESNQYRRKLYFIQYSNTFKDLVHVILAGSDLYWPVGAQPNCVEVLVKVDQKHRQATVLSSCEDEKEIENEFQKVKNWCLEKCLSKTRPVMSSTATDFWILVQYCKSPTEVVYTILNERETHWSEQNLYRDVVAYIQVGETIFQSQILAKSHDFQYLIGEINSIKECAALSSLIQTGNGRNNSVRSISVSAAYLQCHDEIVSI